MKKLNSKQSKFGIITLGSALVVLLIAVVVQSVFLVKMDRRISNLVQPENSVMSRVQVTNTDDQDQKSKIDKQHKSGNKIFPDLYMDDDWFNRPFDNEDWDPFKEMQEMREYMNRMFSYSLRRFGDSSKFGSLYHEQVFAPKIDVTEEKNRFVIRVDLPGVDGANVNVTVTDDRLVKISGSREKKVEKSDEHGKLVRKERFAGHFERTVRLPKPVDSNGMKVEHKQGVLTIYLPKA